jgi:carbamoyltransferase
MLIVSEIKDNLKVYNKNNKELFGIEKLNLKRSNVPAVTHVDYSARIQTVHKETNPIFYDLIKEFKNITGCSVLINTSFNVRGEPIVCNPEDAFKCFMGTNLDMLICNNFMLNKDEQDSTLKEDYKNKYELD